MDIERLISHTSSTLPPPQDQHHDAAPQYPQEIFVPTSPISSSGSSAISSVSPTITTVPVSLQNQQGGGPIRHHNRHHHHHNNQKLPSLYSSPLAPQDAQITNVTIPRTSSPSHHLPSQDQHHSHVHHSTQTPNRRLAHILSEQKRRENINSGFEELKSIVPSCRGCADSKAVILRKAVHYIQNLELEIQKLKHNSIPSTPSPSSSTPSPSPIINNKQLPVNGNNNGSNGNNLSTNGFSGPLPPIRIGVNNGSAVLFENENQKFDNLYKQQPMMQEQPYQFEKQHQFNDQWRPPMNNNNNNSPDQPVAYMHNGNATNHHASFDAPQTTNNMKQQQQQQQQHQNSEYRFRPNPISNSVITKFHPDNNYSPPRVNTNPDDERHFKNEEMDWRLTKPNLYNELPLQQQQQQPPPLFIEHRPCCRNHNPPPSSSLERILVKQEEITGEIRTMVANHVRM